MSKPFLNDLRIWLLGLLVFMIIMTLAVHFIHVAPYHYPATYALGASGPMATPVP